MVNTTMLMEEPVRMATVLKPIKQSFFHSLTKIYTTLGPKTHSVEIIEACLRAGMSVASFDFSWLDAQYHQEALENLKAAATNVQRMYSVMLDTVGPQVQVRNKSGAPIELKAEERVSITPDLSVEPCSSVLPVNCERLAEYVKKGDTIFIGQYLFTGSETTSVWLEVVETSGAVVECVVKNSTTLEGHLFTLHASQVRIDLPTLTDFDKQVISSWGRNNKVDFVSLSFTRHAEDIRELREFLVNNNLEETRIFAKVENVEGLKHFDEILKEADGVILSRGTLGIDLPPEKVFSFQKSAIYKCNMAGKPVVITRVIDSMTTNLRPTRAEATDVANIVLDGADGIMLGAETVRGLYPVEAIQTIGRISAEAEDVYNHPHHFKRVVRYVGEPMPHIESVASSAVRAAIKVSAAVIVVFTTSGRAARLISKYRPTMPVLAVVSSDSAQARQCFALRGIYPIPSVDKGGASSFTDESGLSLALEYGKRSGLVRAHDRIVIFLKIGDSFVAQIIELEE